MSREGDELVRLPRRDRAELSDNGIRRLVGRLAHTEPQADGPACVGQIIEPIYGSEHITTAYCPSDVCSLTTLPSIRIRQLIEPDPAF